MGLITYVNSAVNQRWYFADVKTTDRPVKGEQPADMCWCNDTRELFVWSGVAWLSILSAAQSNIASGRDAVVEFATQKVITHNLNSALARVVFSTTWQTTYDVVSQDANTLTVEFGTEVPAGGGTLIWIAVAS
jgi:hypothetical protein